MGRKSTVHGRMMAKYGGAVGRKAAQAESGVESAARVPATYGSAHRRARATALQALREGEPCHFCGRPMYRTQRLQLDHVVPVVLGGARGTRQLVHGVCNESAGAALGNRLRGKRRATARKAPIHFTSRQW